ncbi:ABC transporter transmembrane domain-containing protein [Thiospirochaeta perfilievii]|uniref:ABC transporter transmembrane domain-containing protein n=1 Tax=Thiospirochaeta perfilievii TaxID=252967 RepID=UPI001658CFAE|nr:ABC transporter ATP-binding protein [Thiospirochaeta perfilievii]
MIFNNNISTNDIICLKYFLKYIKGYRIKILVILILSTLSVGVTLLEPYFLGEIIDSLLVEGFNDTLKPIILIFLIGLVGIFISLLETYITINITVNLNKKIKDDTYKALINMPLKDFDTFKSGELINRVENDVPIITELYINTLISIILDSFKIVGISIILIKLNIALYGVLFLSFPLSLYMFTIFGRKLREISGDIKKQHDNQFNSVKEIIDGLLDIKFFSMEDKAFSSLSQLNFKLASEIKKIKKKSAQSKLASMLLEFLGLIAYIIIGAFQISLKIFTIGGFVSFTRYSTIYFLSLKNITSISSKLQQSMIPLHRIHDLHNLYQNVNKKTNYNIKNLNGDIKFNSVSFSYNESAPVINNTFFNITTNAITGILGDNGSGKSTIVSVKTICH